MAKWVKREKIGFCLNVIHCIEQPCGRATKAWWGYGGVAGTGCPWGKRGAREIPTGRKDQT
jgi:hypothetical protein